MSVLRNLILGVCICWHSNALAQATTAETNPDTTIIADNQEDTYLRCLATAQGNPEIGMEMALRWHRLNGGEPAEHCQAVALMALGDWEEAANHFEILADQPTATAPVKTGLYTQAAQAWMESAAYYRALKVLNKAIVFSPENRALFFDRAITHAALADYWSSIDDLNRVLDDTPDMVDAFVLRGSAYRSLDIPNLAVDDINRALAYAPENTDALLELGLIARDAGDKTAARLAWIQILEIEPQSPTADAVRQHLEEMDLITDP